MLAAKNKHIRDSSISFQEQGHIYTLFTNDVAINPISVTTLIHKFFPEFNADRIIDNMMVKGSLSDPSSKYYNMTKEQIKSNWEKDRDLAASLGTKMHADIERYFNDIPVENPDTVEFKYFTRFWQDFIQVNPHCKPYRTEWLIYDETRKISGSIDFVLEIPNGDLVILDWKRSKQIKKENRFEKGIAPLNNLDNCNFNHYMLQLNLYRHILETKYDKKVIGMYLVILHPDNSNYIVEPIPMYDVTCII